MFLLYRLGSIGEKLDAGLVRPVVTYGAEVVDAGT